MLNNISFAGLKFTRSIKILKSKSLSEQNSILNRLFRTSEQQIGGISNC